MNILAALHELCKRCLRACIDIMRPALGPTIPSLYTPCIFYMDCRTYAHHMLQTRSLLVAGPLIILRILACNPITGICKWMFKKTR